MPVATRTSRLGVTLGPFFVRFVKHLWVPRLVLSLVSGRAAAGQDACCNTPRADSVEHA